MFIIFLIYLIALVLVTWSSNFIAAKTYRNLIKTNSRNAKLVQVLVFIACFIVLGMLALWFMDQNFRLTRGGV